MPLRTFCVRVAGPAMLIAVLVNGCAMMGPRLGFAPPACANPLYVASYNENAVWEATVDVLHEFHFDIARENKLSHVIETAYFTGSNIAEPWHVDSVGLENRLESTFQSIRRRVIVNVIPDERGQGFLVSVEAFKELEDLDGLAANSVGAATFDEFEPLRRDLNPVVGQSAPSGWLPQGRDLALESAVLTRLQQVYTSR